MKGGIWMNVCVYYCFYFFGNVVFLAWGLITLVDIWLFITIP